MNVDHERRRPSLPLLHDYYEQAAWPTQQQRKTQVNDSSTPSNAANRSPINPTRQTPFARDFTPSFFDIDLDLGEKPTISGDTTDTDEEVQRILGTGAQTTGLPRRYPNEQGDRQGEQCDRKGLEQEEEIAESFRSHDEASKVSPIEEYRDASIDANLLSIDGLALIAAAAASNTDEGPSADLDEHRQGNDSCSHERSFHLNARARRSEYDKSYRCAVQADDARREQVYLYDRYQYAGYTPYQQYQYTQTMHMPEEGYAIEHYQSSGHACADQCIDNHRACSSTFSSEEGVQFRLPKQGETHRATTLEAVTQAIEENEREQQKWRKIIEQNKASVRWLKSDAAAANTTLLVPKGINLSLLPLTKPPPQICRDTLPTAAKAPSTARAKKRKRSGSTSGSRNTRGNYKCSLCGQPKANHICQTLQGFNAMQEAETQTIARGGKTSLRSGMQVLVVQSREINGDAAVETEGQVEMIDVGTAGDATAVISV